MFGGAEGWEEAVSDCISTYLGGVPPFKLPQFQGGSFGAAFGIGVGHTEWDLTFKCCSAFGKFIGSVVPWDIAVAWAPCY